MLQTVGKKVQSGRNLVKKKMDAKRINQKGNEGYLRRNRQNLKK